MRASFHAIYLAVGATTPKHPKLPGLDLSGVTDALPFLIQNAIDGSGGPHDDLRDREVQAAKDEGVVFRWLVAPVRFRDDGQRQLRAVECIRMELGDPDE